MVAEQVIVLGAGRPHRGEVPAALRTDFGGVPVLEWMLDALSVSLADVTFVGGFAVEAVRARYPRLRIVEPSDWHGTGSAASLLSAPLERACDAIVVYGDILVRPGLINEIRAGTGEIALAWDSCWRERFAGRHREVLAGREKVIAGLGGVERLGTEIDVDAASGEFVGLARLTPSAIGTIDRLRDELARSNYRGMQLSGLFELIRRQGVNVSGVDVAGEWAEVDEPADIARFVLGTKADTLSRLSRLVTTARIADQVTRTVEEWEQDPEESLAAVVAAFGEGKLIVRSSTTHEDSFSASNAGGFTSVLGVTADDGLLDAVDKVAGSYRRAGIDAAVQQVLIQPLIEDVVVSGVALTRTLDHGGPWIVIEYTTDGDTEAITSGGSSDLRTLVIRRDHDRFVGTRGAAASDEIARVAPLLPALREIEALLGHDGLDVEFAIDDSGAVHLLQVRPAVTASGSVHNQADGDIALLDALDAAHVTWRTYSASPSHLPGAARAIFGIMPDWNPAEIVGTAPGRLALDLYRRIITDEIWAVQRSEVGYRDVRPAPLLVNFAGRPYVDVRASFASFIPAEIDDGLAGRLLSAALDRLAANPHLHDKVEFAVVPTCLDPDWLRWEALLRQEGFDDDEIGTLGSALGAVTRRILGRVEQDLATIRRLDDLTQERTGGIGDPLERAAVLIETAREAGTLPFAHLARAAFVAVSLLHGAQARGILSEEAVAGFHAGVRTVSHDFRADAEAAAAGTLLFEEVIARWGHLRPGTYEVTSPRYDADPERFLAPLIAEALSGATASPSSAEPEGTEAAAWLAERDGFFEALGTLRLGADAAAVERTLRAAIEGREWAKAAFTRNVSDALELIADAWEERGAGRDVIRDAPLEVLLPDAAGEVADISTVRAHAEEGQRTRSLAEVVQLPPLLTAEEDLDVFVLSADTPNFVGVRPVIAPVIVLDDGAVPNHDVRGCIVLIPRADPGFDWLFGHDLAGLVTLYGGANSHMAIRAAEFGLPAAIGVGAQRFRSLTSAAEIELDPRGRTLRVLR